MSEITICPQCKGEHVFFDGNSLFTCPDCWFQFTQKDHAAAIEAAIVRDANGHAIADGANLIVTQDIKLGGSKVIKRGSKAKHIRVLDEPFDGHELECTIDGIGRIYIFAKYVK